MEHNAQGQTATLEPIIRIRDLVFRRGAKTILDGIDLDIHRGSIVAFMGPSGVGKTTILRLISGQLVPDSGTIEVNGQDVAAMSGRQLQRFRRNIGVLLQDGALFTDLTVFENIATPVREHTDLPEPLIRRLVMSKLSAVGLGIFSYFKGTGIIGAVPPALAILVGAFLTFTIYISPQALDEASSIKVGDTIPRFTALDDKKATFNSDSLHGHLVLIKFFRAHW